MNDRQVIKAACFVYGGWWCLISLYWWFSHPSSGFLSAMARQGKQYLVLLAIGIALTVLAILFFRAVKRSMLAGRKLRGLSLSIGDIPGGGEVASAENASVDVAPKSDVKLTYLKSWRHDYAKNFPAHSCLIDKLLRIYQVEPTIPATHVKGGHGGRSLLEHSLLVAGVMAEKSRDFSYTGLTNTDGKLVIGLRKLDYRFDSNDPMIYLVGLAHDIGKIESYVRDEDGQIVGTKSQHDQIGSRMLSRLPETWALPDDDRRMLLQVVAHYHHPQFMPLDMDGRALDDRTQAMQELLILADNIASGIEEGAIPANQSRTPASAAPVTPHAASELDQAGAPESSAPPSPEPEAKKANKTPAQSDSKPASVPNHTSADRSPTVRKGSPLFELFVELISETGRINGREEGGSLGQKYGELIVFHEPSLRSALEQYVPEQMRRDLGTHTDLIVELATTLAAEGVLLMEIDGEAIDAASARFDVEFYSKRKDKAKLAMWKSCVIMKPGNRLPGLAMMGNYDATMKMLGLTGRQSFAERKGAKPMFDSRGNLTVNLELSEQMLNQAISAGPKKKKKQNAGTGTSASGADGPTTKNLPPDLDSFMEIAQLAHECGLPDIFTKTEVSLCKEMLEANLPSDLLESVAALFASPPSLAVAKRKNNMHYLVYPREQEARANSPAPVKPASEQKDGVAAFRERLMALVDSKAVDGAPKDGCVWVLSTALRPLLTLSEQELLDALETVDLDGVKKKRIKNHLLVGVEQT